jgi:hypothetical protein
MAYSNGYAVAILSGGRLLDERQDNIVAVPFGADYVIRLINRNGRRALAKVYVDGQNVTEGGIIVNGYSTVDLEGPTDKPVTFRFASTESKAAADHGKDGPDHDGSKGLIRVEWLPEREILPYNTGYLGATTDYEPPIPRSSLRKSGLAGRKGRMVNYSGPVGQHTNSTNTCSTPVGQLMSLYSSEPTSGGQELESGVTVEGKRSTQTFRRVHFDIDYSKPATVVMVKLKGYVASEGIPASGTTYCPSCRTKTKKNSDRYCRQCGERL